MYRLLRKSFGLKNAVDTVQYAMEFILSTVNCQLALVYLNYVDMFSTFVEEHVDQL